VFAAHSFKQAAFKTKQRCDVVVCSRWLAIMSEKQPQTALLLHPWTLRLPACLACFFWQLSVVPFAAGRSAT